MRENGHRLIRPRALRTTGGPQMIRRPDGLLEIQTTMTEFTLRWTRAADEDKLVLDDPGMAKRPAVWIDRDPAVRSVLAPFPSNWEDWRRRQRHGAPRATKRERTCRQCHAVMELSKETTAMWTFRCPVCESIAMLGKDTVGGTIGAGEKEPDGA